MSAAAARYLNISFIWHTSIGICYQRHLSWYVWLLIILALKQQGWRLFTVSKQMSIQNLRVTKFIIKSGRANVCAIALKQRIRLSWSAMMNPQTHACVAVMSLGRTYLVQIGNHMFDVQVRAFSVSTDCVFCQQNAVFNLSSTSTFNMQSIDIHTNILRKTTVPDN